MIGLLFFGLRLFLLFFLFRFALKRDCSTGLRILTLGLAIGQFFVPYVWIPAFFWGALCWGDARAGD
ncbi:MAG TPA: hypothetical protein PLA90_16575 [Candidatus Sumerlaeota bacterium]|nr:hypothetical protein [Candidatus Sumerlaeota bacterium]HPS03157.1 hypothetical protein [Candidatus Sumerlaeota bacterium]